jgi:hypothetical protein
MGRFRVTILWQFLATSGATTSKSAVFTTFTNEQINAAPAHLRPSMARQRLGVNEDEAFAMFYQMRTYFSQSLFSDSWEGMNSEDRRQFSRMRAAVLAVEPYLMTGIAFSLEHVALLRRIQNHIYFQPPERDQIAE